jgi:Zn-dependent M28 family amino/carboxypeptidase
MVGERFEFWSAEELGLIGSEHYVAGLSKEQRDRITAYLNIDMVARGELIYVVRTDFGPTDAWDRTILAAQETGVRFSPTVQPAWSDHATFAREGMSAAWLWSGEDPAFHSPRDTFDRVQPESVERAGLITLAFLRSYE